MNIGIDLINYYVPKYYLDHSLLAKERGIDEDKFKIGIGQHKMAIISPLEDIVTMALEAAYPIIGDDLETIDTLLFASESGIDFSKSAGNYVHSMLGLNPNVRILELKQACYALTGALHLACDYVRANPTKKALIVSSDVAWYGFDTPGEATQGAGAVAMLIAANPRIATVHKGQFTTDNFPDFYRPSYSDVPVVDGKLSIRCYTDLLKRVDPGMFYPYTCFHLPFANMANKANKYLSHPMADSHLEITKRLGKDIGNIYNGSIYLSLLSVLIYSEKTLENQTIGMFSYGSGAMAEYFTLTLSKNYQTYINKAQLISIVNDRLPVDFETYVKYMTTFIEKEHATHYSPSDSDYNDHTFIIDVIENGHRTYKKV
ncbi:MAG: hydroxymethylglutaryl-CoA synthase family protein [Acholeplasmataceae bacterium]